MTLDNRASDSGYNSLLLKTIEGKLTRFTDDDAVYTLSQNLIVLPAGNYTRYDEVLVAQYVFMYQASENVCARLVTLFGANFDVNGIYEEGCTRR